MENIASSQFGSRKSLIMEVNAFLTQIGDLSDEALSDSGKYGDEVSVAIEENGREIVIDNGPKIWLTNAERSGRRMAFMDMPDADPLSLSDVFSSLSDDGILPWKVSDEIREELRNLVLSRIPWRVREMVVEHDLDTLKFDSVIIDSSPAIRRNSEISPKMFAGISHRELQAYERRTEQERRFLLEQGAVELPPLEGIEAELWNNVLGIQTAIGYRIVASSPFLPRDPEDPKIVWNWDGLPLEMNSPAVHSMEGEKSNIVRAALLWGVRKKVDEILSQVRMQTVH